MRKWPALALLFLLCLHVIPTFAAAPITLDTAIFQMTSTNLLQERPGGEKVLKELNGDKVLDYIQYKERWFNIDETIVRYYFNEKNVVTELKLIFPVGSSKQHLIKQLGAPTTANTWERDQLKLVLQGQELTVTENHFVATNGSFTVPKNNVYTVTKQFADVTGDKVNDEITLVGERQKPTSMFLSHLYLLLYDGQTKKATTLKLDGAMFPTLTVRPLTSKKASDIIVSAPTGGKEDLTTYYVYSFQKGKVTKLPLPAPIAIQGKFLNNYKFSLTVQGKTAVFPFNKDSKALYNDLGYFTNGKLLKPTPLQVRDKANWFYVEASADQTGPFLQVEQLISGPWYKDVMAVLKGTYRFEKGKWVVKRIDVINIQS